MQQYDTVRELMLDHIRAMSTTLRILDEGIIALGLLFLHPEVVIRNQVIRLRHTFAERFIMVTDLQMREFIKSQDDIDTVTHEYHDLVGQFSQLCTNIDCDLIANRSVPLTTLEAIQRVRDDMKELYKQVPIRSIRSEKPRRYDPSIGLEHIVHNFLDNNAQN